MLEIGYITKQSSITYIIRNNTVKNMKMYNRAVSYIRVPPPPLSLEVFCTIRCIYSHENQTGFNQIRKETTYDDIIMPEEMNN